MDGTGRSPGARLYRTLLIVLTLDQSKTLLSSYHRGHKFYKQTPYAGLATQCSVLTQKPIPLNSALVTVQTLRNTSLFPGPGSQSKCCKGFIEGCDAADPGNRRLPRVLEGFEWMKGSGKTKWLHKCFLSYLIYQKSLA